MRSVALDAQIRIAATRRAYDAGERRAAASSCSGTPERWGETLRELLWTRTTLVVPPFSGATRSSCRVPCTYDLEVAAAKYFDALGDGDVPLELLFSGSVFYADDGRAAAGAARIPWESEARYRLPVRVWREAMDATSRTARGCASARDLRPAARVQGARARCRRWEAAIDELLGGRSERWTAIRQVADAVLYEGYILWPYRRSALKNQQRWTFGGVYPAAHSARAPDDRAAIAGAVPARGRRGAVDVRVRFLHVVGAAGSTADGPSRSTS